MMRWFKIVQHLSEHTTHAAMKIWCAALAITPLQDGVIGVEYVDLLANEDDKARKKLRQRVPLERVRPVPPVPRSGGAGGAYGGGRRQHWE